MLLSALLAQVSALEIASVLRAFVRVFFLLLSLVDVGVLWRLALIFFVLSGYYAL